MAGFKDEIPRVYAPDRASWRAWLEEHAADAPGAWLVYYKKGSGKARVPYDEAVEEALCFGWIDGVPNKIDDEKYMQMFTPRRNGSTWSALNKERVDRLIRDGRMTPAGLAKIEEAKGDGSWESLDAVERLEVPPDLAEALAARPPAAGHFDAFAPSSRKGILGWIARAGRPETRARRIEETARMASKNLRAQFDKE